MVTSASSFSSAPGLRSTLIVVARGRRLQVEHQLRQVLLRPVVRSEVFVSAGDEETALTSFGILDRLVDGGDRTDRLEVEHRLGPRLPRLGDVPRQLQRHDGHDNGERNRAGKQREENLSPGAPNLIGDARPSPIDQFPQTLG